MLCDPDGLRNERRFLARSCHRARADRVFERDRRKPGKEPVPAAALEAVPRIARLLALAWKWELAVRRGEVKDYATIARRHGLTRARVTQICALALLAPDRQDAILATALEDAHTQVHEHAVRGIATLVDWSDQNRSPTAIHPL